MAMSPEDLGDLATRPDGYDDEADQSINNWSINVAPEPQPSLLNVFLWHNKWSDDETHHFQPYLQDEKGCIQSESPNGSQCSCSIELLRKIKYNLCMAKTYCFWGLESRRKTLDLCMMNTKEELLRLQQSPELFPSREVEEDFWGEVQECYDLIVDRSIPARKAHREGIRLLREDVVDYWQTLMLPTRDAQRKPWEQFLHNGAPGSGADLSRFVNDGSIQILPMAASRIMLAMLIEHKSIIRDIGEQRDESVADENISLTDLFPKELKRAPDGNMRAIFPMSDLLRPALSAPDQAPRNGKVVSLETLNNDFARLRAEGDRTTRRTWNIVCLVVQDRPFKA